MTTTPHVVTAGQSDSEAMPTGTSRDQVHPDCAGGRSRPSADRPGNRSGSGADTGPDGSAAVPRSRRTVRSWPLLVLAAPAAVAVWSGWVGIGQMTGFGEIRPLPGIWNSLQVNTAVTLPVGVEAYAAYALHAWLTPKAVVSDRTRRFARWSAIGSLLLGMAGQVAYHLLTEAHVTRAPWQVTTLVSCMPVLVLGMGTALAHLLRADASTAAQVDQAPRYGPESIPAGAVVPGPWSGNHADHDQGRTGGHGPMAGDAPDASIGVGGAGGSTVRQGPVHRPWPRRGKSPRSASGRVDAAGGGPCCRRPARDVRAAHIPAFPPRCRAARIQRGPGRARWSGPVQPGRR
jgi:hypothetical protein